jgi:integrase
MAEQKPRRPKGTGSIYERGGVVIGQYEVQTPEGKIKRKHIWGKSKKEVGSKLAKAVADGDKGLVFDCGSMTVGEFLDEWLDSIRASLRLGALRRYEESIGIHIKPTFGKVQLDRLDALRVQSLYRMKLDSGLSPRTVQIIHATLHKALNQAVSWSLIPRNVTESVSPQSHQRRR